MARFGCFLLKSGLSRKAWYCVDVFNIFASLEMEYLVLKQRCSVGRGRGGLGPLNILTSTFNLVSGHALDAALRFIGFISVR